MFAFIVYLSIVTIILLCVLSESFRKLVAKIVFGSLAVALLTYTGFALQNAAHAEAEGFYQKAVFVDEAENFNKTEYLLHVDDLYHLWDYWENKEETFSDFDWEMEKLALLFIKENSLDAIIDTDTCICRGRIVILTMWECDPDDPFDEEVVDVYYTAFVTE